MAAAHALDASPVAAGRRVTLVTGCQVPGARRRAPVAPLRHSAIFPMPWRACASRYCLTPASAWGLAKSAWLVARPWLVTCRCLLVGTQAPAWLASSGLALDTKGFVRVNAFQQSTSHAAVFAAGDVASREDAPHARSGVYAVRAGPPLLANLLSVLNGQPLILYVP